MQGRRALCAVTFAYWHRQIEAGILARAVVVATDAEDLELARSFGFTVVEAPNDVHGLKFDAGVEAATQNMDAVVRCNSAGVIGNGYLRYVAGVDDADWIQPYSLTTFHLRGDLVHFPMAYCSGHGAVVFRSAWESLGGVWCGPSPAGHTDHALFANLDGLRKRNVNTRELMTIKGFGNITPLDDLLKLEHERIDWPDLIAKNFDATLQTDLEQLAMAYRMDAG
jgi:hypothetical protein